MMLRGMYSMVSMGYGDSFHKKCYDTFGAAWARAKAGLPPKGAARAVSYAPSLVAADLSWRPQ